jgi:23S rRNA pseudouridine2605 synthase
MIADSLGCSRQPYQPKVKVCQKMAKQRLQKVLAAAGLSSRRKCEELILSGVVQVNRKVVDKLPAFVDPQKDIITVNNKKIQLEKKVYFLLNKPKGVICTNSDPSGRKRAIDFIPAHQRLFCIGRLDADTTGIIILTNDSELANILTHPRYQVPKTYVAMVKGRISSETVEKLKNGIWLAVRQAHCPEHSRRAEGKTARASIKVLKRSYKESLVEVTVRQGLNRQIRRMLAKVSLPVKSLKRTRIGNLTARGLGIGKFRTLTKAEIAYLKRNQKGTERHTAYNET